MVDYGRDAIMVKSIERQKLWIVKFARNGRSQKRWIVNDEMPKTIDTQKRWIVKYAKNGRYPKNGG